MSNPRERKEQRRKQQEERNAKLQAAVNPQQKNSLSAYNEILTKVKKENPELSHKEAQKMASEIHKQVKNSNSDGPGEVKETTEINTDIALNFLDRNIGYRQIELLPKHKEKTLYHNKYGLELEVLKEIKRRVLRDELKREPTPEEIEITEMPEGLTKYF